MSLINGKNVFDVIVPQFSAIDYAVVNFPYSATANPNSTTGMAGYFGIRKDSKLQFTPAVREDLIRQQTDGFDIKGSIDLYQTDYYSLKNLYLLSKNYVSLAFQANSLDWYNMQDNTATPPFLSTTASPNGSCSPSLGWTYEVTGKDVTAKIDIEGHIHYQEYQWMLNNATSRTNLTLTASQTITQGLSSMMYSQTNYSVPNVQNIVINNGSGTADDQGLYGEDIKITLKTTAPVKDNRNRSIYRFLDCEIDANLLQNRYYDANAIEQWINSDFSVSANLWNGVQLVWQNCASWVGAPDFQENSKFTIPVKLKARVAYDPNGTFQNIQFNDATKTILFTRSVYNS